MSGLRRGIGAVLGPMLLLTVLWGPAAPATARPDGVDMSANVDGRDIADTSVDDPLRLEPGSTVRVSIELSNKTGAPVEIRHVDLAGQVLGLSFFSYSTAVELTIPPGGAESLRYRLELRGLEGQAVGFLGGELAVYGADSAKVAAIPLITDVRGSLWSVYGLFGIALAVLTALAIADAALAVARHRLSANRWQRGLRLLAPGLGIGLVFAFTASVARWWVPDTSLWLAFAGVTAAVAFLLGYASPTPEPDEAADDEPDEAAELDEFAEVDTQRFPPERPGL
ncbi:hypothetical protein [Nocardia brasiliensis]|uniref:Uncharacterized protein n=1 Tax=Nocardia brasiliensis (strain ATCC 700358 / HUJEG-1) TaxID=1133849 RepID=K0ESG0_NOCB7|nr:hypothetical protein [Nocardia brasiliensis]AFT99744.1 hypothetical protein O3I_008910 [Nocardia brasiliensis ATCC 700358]OCF87508.1 hypothetical protein AW168_26485 [Nocardia brasiliensis]